MVIDIKGGVMDELGEYAIRVLDAVYEHKIYGLWSDIIATWFRGERFCLCGDTRDILERLGVLEDFEKVNNTFWRIDHELAQRNG